MSKSKYNDISSPAWLSPPDGVTEAYRKGHHTGYVAGVGPSGLTAAHEALEASGLDAASYEERKAAGYDEGLYRAEAESDWWLGYYHGRYGAICERLLRHVRKGDWVARYQSPRGKPRAYGILLRMGKDYVIVRSTGYQWGIRLDWYSDLNEARWDFWAWVDQSLATAPDDS